MSEATSHFESPTLAAMESPAGVVASEAAVRRKTWGDYAFHAILFAASAAVLTAALLMQIEGGAKVALGGMTLPPLCSMKALTGLDCPGCGMTRSFISLGHGRFADAIAYNASGPLMFAIVAFQLVYRPMQMRRIALGLREYDLTTLGGWAMVGLAVVMVATWLIRAVATLLVLRP